MKSTLAVFLFATLLSPIFSQEVGKPCKDRYTTLPGVCKLTDDCPSVQEKAKKGIHPTICGFKFNTIPIVCCDDPPPSSSSNVNADPLLLPDTSSGETTFTFDSQSESSPQIPPGQSGTGTQSGFDPQSGFGTQNGFGTQSGISQRISQQKCDEYSKSTIDTVNILPLVVKPNPTTVNVTKCEYNGVALIVGGQPAAPGEFPYMAAIVYSDNQVRCGGTLISEDYVVTAAHCTRSRDHGIPIKVILGELNLARNDDDADPVEIDVIEIKSHPQYRPPKKYNDIALLKLRSPAPFSRFIRPACLWTDKEIHQTKAVATGWGTTSFAGDRSDNLLKVALDVFDNSQCSQTYSIDKNIPNGVLDSMLCAGDLAGGKDTCQGDSGGPLLITKEDNNCVFYLVGVTSFGKFCGGVGTPAIYTRVSDFIPWIEQNIWH